MTSYNMKATDAALNDFSWDWSASPEKIMDYIGQIVAWPRICFLQEPGPDGFNGAEYYQRHVLLLTCLEEHFSAKKMIGWRGWDFFLDVLDTFISADLESEGYRKASKVVWNILTKASGQKVAHCTGLVMYPNLGTLLDEHPEVNEQEGKFLELPR